MPSRRNTSAGRPRPSALNTATRAVNRSSHGTVAAGEAGRHGSALIQGMPASPAVAARTMLSRCCARRRAGPGVSSGKSRK